MSEQTSLSLAEKLRKQTENTGVEMHKKLREWILEKLNAASNRGESTYRLDEFVWISDAEWGILVGQDTIEWLKDQGLTVELVERIIEVGPWILGSNPSERKERYYNVSW